MSKQTGQLVNAASLSLISNCQIFALKEIPLLDPSLWFHRPDPIANSRDEPD